MNNRIREILDKGKAKNSSEIDKKAMFSLFHHHDLEQLVKDELLEDLNSETFEDEIEFPNEDDLFARIWSQINKIQNRKRNNKHYLFSFLKLAIVLIIGFIIGILSDFYGNKPIKPVYYEARAPKGSIMELILPDSSDIFLNADSKIRYSISGEHGIREVFLDGEAWFKVEKNKAKPFIVHTPYYDINVTGTKFNVKTYESDNSVTTTLEEGKIILHSTDKFRFNKDIMLDAGEQAILKKDTRKLTIREVNTKWFTSWKDNKLIFVNMTLKELVVLMERKYGVDIEIKNKDILHLHFDGIIKNESIIELLEIIKKTLPINYKIVGQKIEITNKN